MVMLIEQNVNIVGGEIMNLNSDISNNTKYMTIDQNLPGDNGRVICLISLERVAISLFLQGCSIDVISKKLKLKTSSVNKLLENAKRKIETSRLASKRGGY